MLKMVPGDAASLCCPCLAVKTSHVEVDVNMLPYPLHRPMPCSHQTRG
jgi:hypothetical protein